MDGFMPPLQGLMSVWSPFYEAVGLVYDIIPLWGIWYHFDNRGSLHRPISIFIPSIAPSPA